MKKRWVYVLSMLLVISLTAFGAAAEMERIQDVSLGEDALDIIPEEINISDDALDILDDTLDVEIPEDEELQLEAPEMLELVEPDVTEDAVLVDNEEEQIAPVTEEPMMSDASDFEIDENGVLVKYNGPGGDVVIPDGVTEIGESAFAYCNNLTNVSIPNDVTCIGNYAFQGCESLKSVVLPKELSSFDRSVCLNSGVTSLTIQSDLILTDKTGLGGQTFNFDTNITEVVFAEGATRVDGYMFYGDRALKRVVLHDSVSIIGECAFCECGLTEIALPKSLKTIGENAFDCCSSLTSISIASDITATFNGVPLTKVVLGNGVTTVCDNMFSGCGSLTSVTLPDSLTSIGMKAFSGCGKLKDVSIPNEVTSIGASAFYGCKSLTDVVLPKTLKSLGDSAFVNSGVKNLTINSDIATTFNGVPLTKVVLGNGVTTVCDSMFSGCGSLTGITLPDSLTSIGANAFNGCGKLKDLTVPDKATSIGAAAFYGCKSLTGATLPKTLKTLGDSAFANSGVTSLTINSDIATTFNGVPLTKVVLGNGVTTVCDNMFSGCGSLTSITLPDSLTSIGANAFSGCGKLKDMTVPGKVTSIGASAFYGCKSLTDVVLPKTLKSLGDSAFVNSGVKNLTINSDIATTFNGVPLTKVVLGNGVTTVCDSMFSGCGSLTGITLPDSLTSIGANAFNGCGKLKDLTIPGKVTGIGASTFYGCKSLTEVTLPKTLKTLGDSALVNSGVTSLTINSDIATTFNGVPLTKVVLGDGITTVCDSMFSGCGSLTSITLPDSLTNIGANAFNSCGKLKDMTIPGKVTGIGTSAFNGCRSLANIEIPNGVKTINDNTFSGCRGLAGVTIPNSVTGIGSSAFAGCASLKAIVIPDSVTKLGSGAFSGCGSLTDCTLSKGVTGISDSLFNGCTSLKNITLPQGVTRIGAGAFAGCSNLDNVSIPSGVQAIAENAFQNCGTFGITVYATSDTIGQHAFAGVNASRFTVESGVKIIDEYAFYGCKALQQITLPDTVTEIREGAFEQCGMTEFNVPKSVKKIGVAAFFDCRQLRTITLNGGLVSVGREAFFGCRKLEKIIIKNGVASIFDNMFKECESLLSLSIPSSVSYIGSSSFQGCTGLTEVTILGGKGGLSSNAVAPGEVEVASQAFKGCSVMERIHIPETVTKIAEDAFEGCRQLTICGRPGSYAETYAKANYIPFEAEGDPIATPTPTAKPKIKLSKCKVTVKDQIYTGKVLKPTPVVKYGSVILTKGTDYTVSYKNNVKPGTATVTVTGKGSYTGSAKASFAIRVPLSMCKLTVKDQTYTGKALKPSPAVKYGKVALKKGTDYTVAYKNNKAIGTATVTLKGKGKYTGIVNKTFRILPKGVTLSSLSAGKGTITVKWKKGGNITGYQLQYSLKKSFASKKTVTVAKAATTKAVIKKLKSKKTYYVRIRTYKTVKGKKYYSAWSKAKAVKVK